MDNFIGIEFSINGPRFEKPNWDLLNKFELVTVLEIIMVDYGVFIGLHNEVKAH